ncbi:MAG TPA: ribosomal protein L7/L12 [Ktedonobacteraceae bacterium]|nr:ribosomal protein L7/L12 [Ktedonobacteraceae bacterium]
MDNLELEVEVRNRLRRLEQKVDFLLNELGLAQKEAAAAGSLPRVDPALAEVMVLLQQNKKIEAIKLYREITGASLAEAKHAIDNMTY